MTTVETVTGAVEVTALGRTLMHEHVFTFHGDQTGDYAWDEGKWVANAVEKLGRLKAIGWTSMVDLTVFGIGRNVARVARIARETGFTIIAATGMWVANEMPGFFKGGLVAHGPRYLEDLFVTEITEGIADTGIKAAILKCVTDRQGLTQDVETILRSVARAAIRTGVPITTHTDATGETGLLQLRVFRQEEVDLTNVIIGHSDDTTDLAYLQRLMDAGCYIGMDRFGTPPPAVSTAARMDTLAALIAKGYADQIVLSHDKHAGGDLPIQENAIEVFKWGVIPEVVVPGLRARGVGDRYIDLMTIENPRRIFQSAADKAAALAE